MPKLTDNSMDVLLNHVAKTLPESTAERRCVLEALDAVIPAAHAAHTPIRALLTQMDVAEKLQMDLALKFQEAGR